VKTPIETRDYFQVLGLVSIWAGLYFWLGKGIALTVVGLIVFALSLIETK